MVWGRWKTKKEKQIKTAREREGVMMMVVSFWGRERGKERE